MRALIISQQALDPLISKLDEVLRGVKFGAVPVRATYATAEQAIFQSLPDAVLVVLSSGIERGLELLRKLRRTSSCSLLAVGPATDSKLILQALQQGADHYVDESDIETGLKAALSRFATKNEEDTATLGRFLAVLASSGGCGASTMSANLASVLAKEHGKCGLLDLKPGRGDLAALLDLRPQFTIADVCRNSDRLDRSMLEKMLVKHDCGIHLLGAPPSFGDSRSINPQGVNLALTLARKLFSHVVADLEDCFHEEQVAALRQATEIVLVSRLDFTALRNARRVLEYLGSLNIPRNFVRVIINRAGQPGELPVDEAEDALGEKLVSFVPDDPKIFNSANNTGIPAVLKYPKTKAAQIITEVAKFALERRRGDRAPATTKPVLAS